MRRLFRNFLKKQAASEAMNSKEFIPFKKRYFLIDIIYILAVLIFSAYLDTYQCNSFFLPDWLNECIRILNENVFAFMDRHNSYASRVVCFKNVVSFGFLLTPLSAALIFYFRREFFINRAHFHIDQKNFKLLFGTVFLIIIMGYLFLFKVDPTVSNYEPSPRLMRRLYENIDLWTSQVSRTISCTLLFEYLLVEIFAYSVAFFGKTRRKEYGQQ